MFVSMSATVYAPRLKDDIPSSIWFRAATSMLMALSKSSTAVESVTPRSLAASAWSPFDGHRTSDVDMVQRRAVTRWGRCSSGKFIWEREWNGAKRYESSRERERALSTARVATT